MLLAQFYACPLLLTTLYAGEANADDDLTAIGAAAAPLNHIEMHADFKSIELSLNESFALALKNNFDIRIARIEPEIGENGIITEKSIFDPVLKIRGELREDNTPINSQLVGGIASGTSEIPSPSNFPQFFNDSRSFNVSIETLLPTGAIFGLEYNFVRRFIISNPFNAINSDSNSYLEARISQPLLKNFGIFKTRSPIYIARNNKKISLLQFKQVAIDTLNLTQKAYWHLVNSIDDLRVSKVSLKRANDLLKKNRIQVKVGTLAPIELVQAEEGVASQEEAVIIAKHSIKDSEDELKQILNLEGSVLMSDIAIIPRDRAFFKPVELDLDESIRVALENRPDYLEKLIDMDNANINVKQKRNEVLPQLDIIAGVRYSGLGSDFDDSNDGLFSEAFQGEFFGIDFEVPIGMRATRSRYRSAKLLAKQAQLDIEKKEQEVVVGVRKAVRKISTNIQRIKATRKANELAQKRLEAEERKYEVGRSTSLEVLRAQERLAIAEGNKNKAIVDYNISLRDLEAVRGTILEDNDIVIED
ncbi:MAG: TolC family protein [Candidatus Anammoxibacter sp.]